MSAASSTPSTSSVPPAEQTTGWPVALLVGGFLSFVGLLFTPLAGILAVVVAVASGIMLRVALLPKDRSRLKVALGISASAIVLFIVLILFTVA